MTNMDNGGVWPQEQGARPGVGVPLPGMRPQPGGSRSMNNPNAADKGGKRDKRDRATRQRGSTDKAVTKRLLNSQKIMALLLAVLVAGLVFVATTSSTKETYVVRVNDEIQALSAITPNQIEAVSMPDYAIEPGAISAPTAKEALDAALELIKNGRMRQFTPSGRQLRTADISPEGQLREPLAADERLVSIEASVASAIGGQLQAGDRVDIVALASISTAGDEQNLADFEQREGRIARQILSDVEIVNVLPGAQAFDSAAQQQTGPDSGRTPGEILPANPVPGIYVLRVTYDEAVVLGLVNGEADLFLTLRGAEAGDPTGPNQPLTLEELLGRVAPETTTPAGTATTTTQP
jgi:Flp pilus assembly protein CpaB